MHLTKDEKSIETHVQDTMRAGDGLVDQEVIEFIARSGHKATEWLINHGVIFSQDKKLNQLHLVLEGGHSVPRVAHAGDATGRAILDVLINKALKHPNITILKNTFVIDLIENQHLIRLNHDNNIYGVYALNTVSNEVTAIPASHVVLATGGMGKVYQYTSNPTTATGDGIALAMEMWMQSSKS